MNATKDITWLAGLLEGEGCFTMNNTNTGGTPMISLSMTDRDVVERAASMFGRKVYPVLRHNPQNKPNWKLPYRVSVYGRRAIEWMMTVYSLMGSRRQEKIRQTIAAWHKMPRRQKVSREYQYC